MTRGISMSDGPVDQPALDAEARVAKAVALAALEAAEGLDRGILIGGMLSGLTNLCMLLGEDEATVMENLRRVADRYPEAAAKFRLANCAPAGSG